MHRTTTIVALAASGLFTTVTNAVTADTITVCASGCQYTSINAAIDAASDGDVILLAAETYYEGERINTDGKAITLRGATDKSGDPASILDGADSHQLIECQNDEGTSTRFENLVIQNGYAQSGGAGGLDGGDGGGMYMRDCTPTLVNCHFLYNRANSEAGGLNVNGSDAHPILTDCVFIGNEALYGGAIYLEQSNITMTDCRFEANAASGATWSDGGAFYLNNRCLAVLTRCAFTGNTAVADAGAIYLDGVSSNPESLTMIDCEILNNTAGESGGGIHASSNAILVMEGCFVDGNNATRGGALRVTGSDATLADCIFIGNEAVSGGVVYLSDSSITMNDCSVEGNTATGATWSDGGALYLNGNTRCLAVLTGCTLSGNSAVGEGGGIYLDGSSSNSETLTMTDCEISNNTAGENGGGIHAASDAILVMEDCVVEGNTATAGYGGGIVAVLDSTATLDDCTLSNNAAGGDGGGIMNVDASMATLVGCTLSNNAAGGVGGGLFTGEYDASVTDVTDLALCGNTPENIGGTQPTGTIQCNSTAVDCSDCTDSDGDGIPDFMDVCAGADDLLDTDSDGTPDCLDDCPDDPLKTEPGDCGCGVVDTSVDGDLDCDGDYDEDDIRVGMAAFGITEGTPGDMDGDDDVDAADFVAVRDQIGVEALGCVVADINGDGQVDGADFAYVLGYWGICAAP